MNNNQLQELTGILHIIYKSQHELNSKDSLIINIYTKKAT